MDKRVETKMLGVTSPADLKTAEQIDEGEESLHEFGYEQELSRKMGLWGSFACAFSLISVGGGLFLVFNFGLSSAGPAFIWSWIIGGLLQVSVGLSIAEVASAYPLAGSVYNWTRKLGNDGLAWILGWVLILAHIIATAGLDFGLAPYALNIFGVSNPSVNLQVITTIVLLLIQTILNVQGVKFLEIINGIGSIFELIGMSSVLVILIIMGSVRHSISFLMTSAGTFSNGWFIPLVLALMIPAWTISSFDSTGNISEEMVHPKKNAPRGVMLANVAAYIYGIFIIAIPVLSITDLSGTMKSDLPLQFIMLQYLGPTVTTFFEVIIMFALFVCGMMIQAAAGRIIWGQARDKTLPGSNWLHKLNKGKVPANAILSTFIIAIVFSVWSQALNVLGALAALAWAIPYGVVVAISLYSKIKGTLAKDRGWNLGKWGMVNDVVAILWSLALVVILPLNGLVTVGGGMLVVLVVGIIFYYAYGKKQFKVQNKNKNYNAAA